MNIEEIIKQLEIKSGDNIFIYLPSNYLVYKRPLEFNLKANGVNNIVFHEVDIKREEQLIGYLDMENIVKYPMFDYSDFNKYAKLNYKFIIFNIDRLKEYKSIDHSKINKTINHINSTREYYLNTISNGNVKNIEIEL